MKDTKLTQRISIIFGATGVFFGAVSMFFIKTCACDIWIPFGVMGGFFFFMFLAFASITSFRETYNHGFKHGEKAGEQKAFNEYIQRKNR